MKRKLNITEKKVRAFLILGSIFTIIAAVVAVITQFVVSDDSSALFGHTNMNLHLGLNNITGNIENDQFKNLRFTANSAYDMTIDPSGNQTLYVKKGFVPFSDTDKGDPITSAIHVNVCSDSTIYIGVQAEAHYLFTIEVTASSNTDCGFLIPPSFLMALAVGGIFLFVGILFFILACIYKSKYRATKAGYMHMTDNIEESNTVFTL